jgi:hypothetical protein
VAVVAVAITPATVAPVVQAKETTAALVQVTEEAVAVVLVR